MGVGATPEHLQIGGTPLNVERENKMKTGMNQSLALPGIHSKNLSSGMDMHRNRAAYMHMSPMNIHPLKNMGYNSMLAKTGGRMKEMAASTTHGIDSLSAKNSPS